MVNEGSCKKKGEEVTLLDLSIALDFVFYNTNVHSKRETLGLGHRYVDRLTMFNALENSHETE